MQLNKTKALQVMNKSFLTLSLIFLASLSVFGQSPQSFNYQTVIRDINYEVLADQQLTLRLSIIEDEPSGVVVYQEKHSVTTSAIGLVNLSIGEGNVSSGNFESIDWANHTFFLEVAADFNNDNDDTSLALNVKLCFKARLQLLNIRVKSTTTFTFSTSNPLLDNTSALD